jgi:uncharacterized membrane protein (DUF485 family)
MTEPLAPRGVAQAAHTADHPHREIDWEAIEHSPEFQELVRKRRSWVLPATIFFFSWYFGFIILAGYAEDFMGSSVYEGLTVGYVLALSQFVMTFGLGFWYLRKADRDFDPLARRAIAHVRGDEAAQELEPAGQRFVREQREPAEGRTNR